MDPITVLGAAAAVAQFAELALKAIDLTTKLYTAFKDQQRIQNRVKQLQILTDLANDMKRSPDLEGKPVTEALKQLNVTAQSLVDVLETVQVDLNGSDSTGRKFWKAVNGMRHEEEILDCSQFWSRTSQHCYWPL